MGGGYHFNVFMGWDKETHANYCGIGPASRLKYHIVAVWCPHHASQLCVWHGVAIPLHSYAPYNQPLKSMANQTMLFALTWCVILVPCAALGACAHLILTMPIPSYDVRWTTDMEILLAAVCLGTKASSRGKYKRAPGLLEWDTIRCAASQGLDDSLTHYRAFPKLNLC